ncbi:tyrosine-type recombinase/integrase [Limnoglobus roseus]|uniref:Site-specific integrase n=1 Tax=Limnoglobus roseus TaxID=2598579 RepID=A0A5C1AP19_9BACT|nr:site-specific integrase [Limnoglobus roseus]QEL19897.1 site-specific integrase [Limnoglobus roseus]
MPRKPLAVPTYRLHKQSGQAIVTIRTPAGRPRDVLLGVYDSDESKREYSRIIAELQKGRFPFGDGRAGDLTVNELLVRFLQYAKTHYRYPDGRPTGEYGNYISAVRPLAELYGDAIAAEFGPLALKNTRERMIDRGWCRNQVNAHVGRIKRAFKWATSEELVPPAVYHALVTVTGLREGRSAAVESAPVPPVADEHVAATLPHLNRHARGMVEVQRLTGCRPGEVCGLRMADVDASGPVWFYRPAQHKTRHRGKARVVAIGPKAQAVIRAFIPADPTAYVFSPRRAVEEHHAERGEKRATPRYPSHMKRNRTKRAYAPRRSAGAKYTRTSYARCVTRAVEAANLERSKAAGGSFVALPHWAPNQLRHTFATEVRKSNGLEAAQVLLGHTRADVTQVYAERDLSLAAKVAAEIG